MLDPPCPAAGDRPPGAVVTECVGAFGVLISSPVLVLTPLLAWLSFADYHARRGGLDHAPVTPAELRTTLGWLSAFAAGAGWVLLMSVQLLRRRRWARRTVVVTYGSAAVWLLVRGLTTAAEPVQCYVGAALFAGLALLADTPAVWRHVAEEQAGRRGSQRPGVPGGEA